MDGVDGEPAAGLCFDRVDEFFQLPGLSEKPVEVVDDDSGDRPRLDTG